MYVMIVATDHHLIRCISFLQAPATITSIISRQRRRRRRSSTTTPIARSPSLRRTSSAAAAAASFCPHSRSSPARCVKHTHATTTTTIHPSHNFLHPFVDHRQTERQRVRPKVGVRESERFRDSKGPPNSTYYVQYNLLVSVSGLSYVHTHVCTCIARTEQKTLPPLPPPHHHKLHQVIVANTLRFVRPI